MSMSLLSRQRGLSDISVEVVLWEHKIGIHDPHRRRLFASEPSRSIGLHSCSSHFAPSVLTMTLTDKKRQGAASRALTSLEDHAVPIT